jgi:type III pantothenate kinase
LTLVRAPRWLLIGNSRWHWAERTSEGKLRGWDRRPGPAGVEVAPLAWAAVGPPPDPALCPPERQVGLAAVPLLGCPPWLGVDRALAGWQAWREVGEAVMVVDAGTVLSLTRVDGEGRFRGGRLVAGLRLQLEAMAQGTARLGAILAEPRQPPHGAAESLEEADWPADTAAAMRVGVEAALAAAVLDAAQLANSRTVVLTGGDAPMLLERCTTRLGELGLRAVHRPLLCLRGLAELRPEG